MTKRIWVNYTQGLLATALFLVQAGWLCAQTNNYFFEHMTIGQGLSHNTVYALLQDHQGFLWIGTQSGLNRYDGNGYKIYRSGATTDPNFKGSAIYALLEDRDHNIWVGTQKNGINVLDARTGLFRNLGQEARFKFLANAFVYALYQDRKGNVWMGMQGMGVVRYHPQSQTVNWYNVSNSSLPNNDVFEFAEDASGKIWIATGSNRLCYFDPQRQQFTPYTFTDRFLGFRKTLLLEKGGAIWLGTEGYGLFHLNPATSEVTTYTSATTGLRSDNIRDLEWASGQQMLIATDGGGLNFLDTTTRQITALRYNPYLQGGLNTDALFKMLITPNNIWIGTYNGGVNVHKPHKLRFESYTHTGKVQGELSHRSVLSLLETRNGRIWAGTDGGGLNEFHPESKTFSALQNQKGNDQSIGGNIIKALYEDVSGNIWIGIYDKGLDVYQPETGRFKHYHAGLNNPNALINNTVWCITGTPEGQIWIGTLGHGLNLLNPKTGQFTHMAHVSGNANSPSENVIMSVHYDRQNRLWIGTANKGVDVLDPKTGKYLHFKYDKNRPTGISGNETRAIFEDQNGSIWIGTEDGGLNKWLGQNRFEHYSTKEGLASNSVMGIAQDMHGNIWVSTLLGVSKIDLRTKKIQNFDFNHGAQANQFNQQALIATRKGDVMMGGINGLNLLNRTHNLNAQHSPDANVLITGLNIFNQPVLPGLQPNGRTIYEGLIEEAKSITLSYLDNVFSVEFASLDFDEPGNNRFKYKLEGFDHTWHTVPPFQRMIGFTNLEPRTYLLRIIGSNSMGVWSTREAKLTITIKPPFWQTLWFRLIMLGITLVLVWLGFGFIIKQRERHLHEKMLEADAEILRLQNQNLATELVSKNTQLVSIGLQVAHKNDFLNNIKKELREIPVEHAEQHLVNRMIRMVESEVKQQDFWKQFNVFFNEVNKDFTEQILKAHPDLSQNDIRLCSLMIINLNTKEIASILNIDPKSVEKSRNRLKKKLSLTAEDDLKAYLQTFK